MAALRQLDALIKIGQLYLDWINASDIAGQKPVELLETLYGKTVEYLRGGVSIDSAHFTSVELNAAMKGQKESDDSPDVASRYVRDNLKKYQTLLEEHRDELDVWLRSAGVVQRIVISKVESKGRNKSYYYLDLEPFDNSDEYPAKLPARAIQYRVSQLPNAMPWAKPFLKYTFIGWRKWLYVGVLGTIGLFVFMLQMLIVDDPRAGLIDTLISVFLLGVLFWVMFGGWFMLTDRRIAEAPFFLVPSDVQNAQLEFIKTEMIGSNGRPVREIRLVVYEAICPLCKSKVEVVKSGWEFHRRLIGQCTESPQEHIYSFDRITKIGVPLRSNGYYGDL